MISHGPDGTRTLTVERTFPHAAEKVWRALTTGALIEDWMMANDFVPEVGRQVTFRTEPSPHWDGIVRGEVLEVEPPTRLSYSWTSGALDSVVTFILTPLGGATRLVMQQSGFAPGGEHYLKGATAGWQRFLDAMGGVVDKL